LQPIAWNLGEALPSEAMAALGRSRQDPPIVLSIQRQQLNQNQNNNVVTGLLTADEQVHQATFRREEDRQRYLLGRAGIRILLANLLGLEPHKLLIKAGSHGKPELVSASHGPPPHFNITHAGDLILLAFHPSLAVGVDVEKLDRNCRWDRLAQRVFCKEELAELEQLPPGQRSAKMLLFWCRLEAELKCLGHGLAGLEDRRRRQGKTVKGLAIWDLCFSLGYCGAVACMEVAR
jgi:4'-phosphopantetheinyl transferase